MISAAVRVAVRPNNQSYSSPSWDHTWTGRLDESWVCRRMYGKVVNKEYSDVHDSYNESEVNE